MLKHFLTRTAPGIVAAAIFVVLPLSCVNEEYDLGKIDTTVQFGGNALVFPLGSTEQLKLETLLPENEYLQLLTFANEKVWGFRMSDEMDLSDEIPDLKGYLDIEDIPVSSEIDETLEIDLSNADIEETVFPDPDDPDSGDAQISFDDMDMPDLDELMPGEIDPVDMDIDIAKYYPDENQLTLHFPTVTKSFSNLLSQNDWNRMKDLVEGSGLGPDVHIPVGAALPSSLELINGTEANVNVYIELPEGISNIRDVKFAPGAQMNISISLTNSFLAEGSVTPGIRIEGLGDFVRIDDESYNSQDGSLDLSDMVLSAQTPAAARSYALTGLPDMEWNGNKLDTSIPVNATGHIVFSGDIATTANLIGAQQEMLGVEIVIGFSDIMIADMAMDVEPVDDEVSQNMEMEIGDISLPSEVKSVERVDMAANSGIVMNISSENLSQISGLDADLTSLLIKFPEALEFGTYPAYQTGSFDPATKTLSLQDIDLKTGVEIFMPVVAIIPPAPETSPEGQQVIRIDGNVDVDASYRAGGYGILLSELPTDGGIPVDASIVIAVTPNLSVADYTLTLNEIEPYDVDVSQDITMTFGKEVGDLGTIKVTPHEQKQITLAVNAPEFDDISITGNNLKVAFPQMLVFRNTGDLDEYGYNPEDNSLNFNGPLPADPIVLDIDYILIDPVQVPGSDPVEYTAGGPLTVSGSVSVAADEFVHKQDVDKLVANGISITGNMPALHLADCNVSVEQFKYSVDQTQTVTLFDPASLQGSESMEGLESLEINMVELSDTKFALDIDIVSLPEGLENADLRLNLDITLPEEIIIEENPDFPGLVTETDNGKVLHLNEVFENGRVSVDYVKISGLDMTGTGNLVTAEEPIMRDIVVRGNISAENATVTSPEQLNGGVVKVNIEGGIRDITVDRVTGYIDYVLGEDGSMDQNITLEDLPDFVKGEDFTLDFEKPYIQLTVNSNVGIPVEGRLSIIPNYADGPDENAKQTVRLSIPAADGTETVHTYWIAKSDEDMPNGYEFLQADISALLKKIPESIDIKIDAGTVADELCDIDMTSDYLLTMNYEVVVPFVFGDDLDISMEYTFPGEQDEENPDGGESTTEDGLLPPVLGELLEMNSLGLGGYIESALPLQLELTMDLLDSHDSIIELEEPVTLNIGPGTVAEPEQYPIDAILKLAEGADGTDLSKIRMNFKVTSGNMSGEPVTDMSYIKAVLKVKVPGGITIDLSTLGESENK